MKRRDFLAASCLAGTASLAQNAMAAADASKSQQFLELREYRLSTDRNKKNQMNAFLKQALIPAANRLGVASVGVLMPKYGPNQPTLYVLLPHPSVESVVTFSDRLLADKEFVEQGADFLNVSMADAIYARVESSLLHCFDGLPQVQVPQQRTDNKPRIFELRTYDSHCLKMGKKKVEMFNKGGEIAIFQKTGLRPVFFAETLIGPKMPCLNYMLAFDDMTARDAAWANFSQDPDWKALRSDEQYNDTVSNITDVILRPAPFSQI